MSNLTPSLVSSNASSLINNLVHQSTRPVNNPQKASPKWPASPLTDRLISGETLSRNRRSVNGSRNQDENYDDELISLQMNNTILKKAAEGWRKTVEKIKREDQLGWVFTIILFPVSIVLLCLNVAQVFFNCRLKKQLILYKSSPQNSADVCLRESEVRLMDDRLSQDTEVFTMV